MYALVGPPQRQGANDGAQPLLPHVTSHRGASGPVPHAVEFPSARSRRLPLVAQGPTSLQTNWFTRMSGGCAVRPLLRRRGSGPPRLVFVAGF